MMLVRLKLWVIAISSFSGLYPFSFEECWKYMDNFLVIDHAFFLLAEFTLVKEYTLDVQNTIAPPKQKQPKAVNAKALDIDSPKFVASPKSDDKSEKPQTTNEQGVGNGSVYNKSDDGSAKSAPNSPFASSTIGSPHRDFVDSDIQKTSGEDSSPRNQDDVQETQRYGF